MRAENRRLSKRLITAQDDERRQGHAVVVLCVVRGLHRRRLPKSNMSRVTTAIRVGPLMASPQKA